MGRPKKRAIEEVNKTEEKETELKTTETEEKSTEEKNTEEKEKTEEKEDKETEKKKVKEGKKLKFISWNVNGISGLVKKNKNILLEMVEKEKPDVLCIQVISKIKKGNKIIIKKRKGNKRIFTNDTKLCWTFQYLHSKKRIFRNSVIF
jgi:hypothetical protein